MSDQYVWPGFCQTHTLYSHIREVLQDDPGRMEGDLNGLVLVLLPIQNVANVLLGHLELITVSHCRLQQHTNGVRQML